MVEQRSQSAGDDTGCELVVRVEQRDGPVAGWLRSVCPLALVEQGDLALGHVRWQRGCARLEGLAEHGGELRAKLIPEALHVSPSCRMSLAVVATFGSAVRLQRVGLQSSHGGGAPIFISFLGKKAYMPIDANLVSNPKDRQSKPQESCGSTAHPMTREAVFFFFCFFCVEESLHAHRCQSYQQFERG